MSEDSSAKKTNEPPKVIKKGGVFADRIPDKKPVSSPKPKSGE